MKELVVNAKDISVSKSTLYSQKKNGKFNIIYPRTTADNVYMSDDATIEDKLIGISADVYQAAQTAIDAYQKANQVFEKIPTLSSLGGVSDTNGKINNSLQILNVSPNSPGLLLKSSTLEFDKSPAEVGYLEIKFQDKNNYQIGNIYIQQNPNGTNSITVGSRLQTNGYAYITIAGTVDEQVTATINKNPPLNSADRELVTAWWVNQKLGSSTSLTTLANLDIKSQNYVETLEIKKQKAIVQINVEAQQAIYSGFPYEINGKEYRIEYGLFDQVHLQYLYIDALYNPEEEKELPCQDEVGTHIWLPVSGEIILAIHKYALTFKTAIRKEADEKKTRIMACKTKVEVDEVLKK